MKTWRYLVSNATFLSRSYQCFISHSLKRTYLPRHAYKGLFSPSHFALNTQPSSYLRQDSTKHINPESTNEKQTIYILPNTSIYFTSRLNRTKALKGESQKSNLTAKSEEIKSKARLKIIFLYCIYPHFGTDLHPGCPEPEWPQIWPSHHHACR